jgi:DNA-binding transcriptional LysR family regulator
MDFRHIRAFLAVADASSVTRAAERLHITQPPLTRHIHQLEQELGVTLFVRHRQGVTLTEAGHQLLAKARSLDMAATDFLSAARQAARGDSGTLRVGIGWGLWDLAHKVRVEFARHVPHVTVEASDALCHLESDEQLKHRTLDIVFTRPPFDPAFNVSEPIVREPIQAVIGADSPLAAQDSVCIRDLARQPLLLWDRHIGPVLYDRILELYARADVAAVMVPTPGAGPYNPAGLMLVASGNGVYLGYGVPLTGPQPPSGVAVRPVSDAGATMEVCVVSRRDDRSPFVAAFLECVARVFPPERRAAPAGDPAPIGVREPVYELHAPAK